MVSRGGGLVPLFSVLLGVFPKRWMLHLRKLWEKILRYGLPFFPIRLKLIGISFVRWCWRLVFLADTLLSNFLFIDGGNFVATHQNKNKLVLITPFLKFCVYTDRPYVAESWRREICDRISACIAARKKAPLFRQPKRKVCFRRIRAFFCEIYWNAYLLQKQDLCSNTAFSLQIKGLSFPS